MLNSSNVNEDILIKLKFKIIIWLIARYEYSCYVPSALYLNAQSVDIPIISVFLCTYSIYFNNTVLLYLSPLSLMHLCLHSVNFGHYNFKTLTVMLSNCTTCYNPNCF